MTVFYKDYTWTMENTQTIVQLSFIHALQYFATTNSKLT